MGKKERGMWKVTSSRIEMGGESKVPTLRKGIHGLEVGEGLEQAKEQRDLLVKN